MNPIANAALARAMAFAVPTRKPVARATPKKQPAQQPAPIEKKTLAIPGKPERPKDYDHFGFLEGKRDAIDFVMSMTATLKMPNGKQQVTNQLKQAASKRPASQALGVWHVIELIEGAL